MNEILQWIMIVLLIPGAISGWAILVGAVKVATAPDRRSEDESI